MSGYMAQRLQKRKLSLPSWRSAQAKTNSYFQLQLPHRELIMMSLISQASRQQFIQQSFPAVMRMQGVQPPTMPRMVVRGQRTAQLIGRPDKKSLYQLEVQIEEKKINKEKKIKPVKVKEARDMPSTSNINPPSKYILIPKVALPMLDTTRFFQGRSVQLPVGVYGKDRYVHGQVKVQTRKPGEGPFSHVKKGAYDVRGLKYLYVINEDGVHIKREMSYASSNRGIVCHPKIAPHAYLGGEVWFLPEKEGKAVHINLNSGRFPAQSDEDLHAAAKVWLSLGYDKVYVTPRDQRYGEVTPLLFMPETKS